MGPTDTSPGEGFSTVGIDSTPLDGYADIDTAAGETIIYAEANEAAWIQSDLYYARETVA